MAHKTGAVFSKGSMEKRHLTHGCANAIYLPYVIRYNSVENSALNRYADIARMLGLSGGSNAGEKRKALLKKLNLPEHMSANAMLQALNLLYTREELEQMLNESGIERD